MSPIILLMHRRPVLCCLIVLAVILVPVSIVTYRAPCAEVCEFTP